MPQARTSIADELSGSFASARGLLSSILDLFTLEARRAGLTLALMLACGAFAAILVAAAWLGLMAAVVLCAVSLGSSWQAGLAATALANGALAAALYWLCSRMSRDLLFPGTRRQLRPTRLELV
jgi:H+/Cl- antiporter ClcA